MMKINEIRKSTRQLSNNSNATKKRRQSLTRQRLRTFADIKHCIDLTPQSTASKSTRFLADTRLSRGIKSSFYNKAKIPTEGVDPEKYFCPMASNTKPETLETRLFDEFFGLSCKKSESDNSQVNNLAITESYEFVEMNNNSIHVSRVFRSQLTNSFKTASNREDVKNPPRRPVDSGCDKENCRNDEQQIATMLRALKKNIQMSGMDACRKQSMVKGIAEMEETLRADERFKGKHLSQESFGKYLHNRQLPNSIEAFKNL